MKSLVAVVVAVVGCALLCLHVQPVNGKQVKVAAFNIKNFGMSRFDREWLTNVLIKVLCQYDLVFAQEILTYQNTDTPVTNLGAALNAFAKANYPAHCRHSSYTVHYEGPLGTTSHKEFYVLFYNTGAIEFNGIHIFPQEKVYKSRIFERPPIVAVMRLLSTGDRFIFIGIHTQPRNAEVELNALSNVFAHAANHYGIHTGFMLGDFNVEYLSPGRIEALTIFTDPNIHWLLHGVHTNVPKKLTSQKKLYDQIVAVGNRAMQCYVPNSARVNQFDHLVPNGHIPWEVSDHYPIEMTLSCP